jgi:endonuclease/exonuclease/phosphatase family metal-dependent hydrolase
MNTFKVATYNIHKGVQGMGPARRLEIHNLGHAIEQFDADVVCLQEVRAFNRLHARRFAHWPDMGQADFLAPEGYTPVYRTNAITKHGEHGNALLSRWPVLEHSHENMSDHRFEQRGLLHTTLRVQERDMHVIVVHLGLLPASRVRQVKQLQRYIARDVTADMPVLVAGDFNDWQAHLHRPLAQVGLKSCAKPHLKTFPARWPVLSLDRVYARGLESLQSYTPEGVHWARLSDHLPLVTEFKRPLRACPSPSHG